MRERDGRTLPQVYSAEEAAVPAIRQRINHQDGYSLDGACTNGAESYFSRLRRSELGHHHHIAGPYLLRYAQEMAWREDRRRVSNGEQVHGVVGLAMRCRPSVDFCWCGYWQRARAA
jgi:hypothetical protein